VESIVLRGDDLEAAVQGSEPLPYSVHVSMAGGQINDASCTCQYAYGGWCKHIVAALLVYLNNQQDIERRPALDELLQPLDHDQLVQLIAGLVERDPALSDAVERRVALVRGHATDIGKSSAVDVRVDPEAVRRQVRESIYGVQRMRPSEAYWHVGAVVADVRRVLDDAWAFIRAGDGENAIETLDALTQEYFASFGMLDDSEGEASAFFAELAPAWTEAFLTAELSPDERDQWARTLESWMDTLRYYDVSSMYEAPYLAATLGWQPLPEIEGDPDDDEFDGPFGIYDLITARLNVLERQERFDEFLRLALESNEHARYAAMLARMGRENEAVGYAQSHVTKAEHALTVATALHERGDVASALAIGRHGLGLPGERALLASWLRDVAAHAGDVDLAVDAATAVIQEQPTLTDWLRAKDVSGERWEAVRADLLQSVRGRRSGDAHDRVDIFLHEGLVDDAINAVRGAWDYDLIARVADAAVDERPDWVADTSRKQAEAIMDQGISAAYDTAATWLARMRKGLENAGRGSEWPPYIAGLIATHKRKYKLRPLLEDLARP
jgi:uncharacterized Zn finger protein